MAAQECTETADVAQAPLGCSKWLLKTAAPLQM